LGAGIEIRLEAWKRGRFARDKEESESAKVVIQGCPFGQKQKPERGPVQLKLDNQIIQSPIPVIAQEFDPGNDQEAVEASRF